MNWNGVVKLLTLFRVYLMAELILNNILINLILKFSYRVLLIGLKNSLLISFTRAFICCELLI